MPDTTETVEEDGSTGLQPRQFEGANGARSEHGTLARHKYDLLPSEETEGGPSNAGADGGKEGHGAVANREGT